MPTASPIPTPWYLDAALITAWITGIGVIVAICTVAWQIRHARFVSGIELLLRFEERFESTDFRQVRRAAAQALLANKFDEAAAVLNFFELVGLLLKKKALDATMVWHAFGLWVLSYHLACDKFISEKRKFDPNDWTELCYLYGRMEKLELRHHEKHTIEHISSGLRTLLENEARPEGGSN